MLTTNKCAKLLTILKKNNNKKKPKIQPGRRDKLIISNPSKLIPLSK